MAGPPRVSEVAVNPDLRNWRQFSSPFSCSLQSRTIFSRIADPEPEGEFQFSIWCLP
jgi:hypothetical protein